ncbi:MAG: hypothetical protein KDD61_04230 [Bdellovibrionales bacterium]|nr:hypothetical protein [Bdellovibrionales bacterium]
MKLIFSLLILASIVGLSFESATAEPSPDLPPLGSSLFDKLYSSTSQNTEITHKLPFPYERLKKSLSTEEASVSTLVPFGRSIQKPHLIPEYENEIPFNPFQYPRALIGVHSDSRSNNDLMSKPKTEARIFVGYLEPKKQLEVISYNEELGRFEFQVVKDYGPNLNPKVYYVKRTLCTKCHQNEAPIFSPAQWDDTNNNFTLGRLIRVFQVNQENHYQSIPIRKGGSLVQQFDGSVRDSNRILEAQKVWKYLCQNDSDKLECRKAVLLMSLKIKEPKNNLPLFNRISEAFASPDSPKRITSFIGEYNPILAQDPSLLRIDKNCQETNNCLQNHYSDPTLLRKLILRGQTLTSEEDPSTPRQPEPIISYSRVQQRLERMLPRLLDDFLEKDVELAFLENIWQNNKDHLAVSSSWIHWLENEILNPSSLLKDVLLDDTFSRNKFILALVKQINIDAYFKLEQQLVRTNVAPAVLYEKPLLDLTGPLKVLERRCGDCHSGPSNYPPPFLKASSAEEIKINLKTNNMWSKAIAHIKGEKLPKMPLNEPMDESEEDFRVLIEFLETIPLSDKKL